MPTDVTTGFNTQPPEGGWDKPCMDGVERLSFNTQPPEGGWYPNDVLPYRFIVSTHSRLKAAG